MRQERGIPDEERRFSTVVDELNDRLEAGPPDLQAEVSVATSTFWIAMRHCVGESGEPWMTFPPLARLEAPVALRGEPAWQGGVCPNVLEHFAAIGSPWWVIPGDSVLVRVEAGDHGCQAGATEAAGHVGIGEHCRLSCETIDVRGANCGVAHEAEVGPGLIVGDDQKHVRRGRMARGRSCHCR